MFDSIQSHYFHFILSLHSWPSGFHWVVYLRKRYRGEIWDKSSTGAVMIQREIRDLWKPCWWETVMPGDCVSEWVMISVLWAATLKWYYMDLWHQYELTNIHMELIQGVDVSLLFASISTIGINLNKKNKAAYNLILVTELIKLNELFTHYTYTIKMIYYKET